MIEGLAKVSLEQWMRKELRKKFSHPLAQRVMCAKRPNPHPLAEGVSLSETIALSPKTSLELHLMELG